MITLGWPLVLVALPLPLLARWLLPPARDASVGALRLPSLAGLAALAPPQPPATWRRLLAGLIWALLVIAAARPQSAGAPIPLALAGRDLLLAIDISGSMQQEAQTRADAPASRLDLVKDSARQLLARRPQDRLGLILFADHAHVLTPLTYDHVALAQMLDEAIIGLAGTETAIGDAIGLAVRRLRAAPPGQRVLVLFTDGASNAGSLDPLTAAGLAADAGIRIYTVGIGPPPGAASMAGDLDPDLLRAVAEATGGRFFRASDGNELARVSRLLDQLEPNDRAVQTYRPLREHYPWPAGTALALVAALVLGDLPRTRRAAPPGAGHG